MIDWCKSNKNIALFITLPSKDSPNGEEVSTNISARCLSISVDYLFGFVYSSSCRNFSQTPLVEHLQYFLNILNSTFITFLLKFFFQNTHFFKSLHTLDQTLHADG